MNPGGGDEKTRLVPKKKDVPRIHAEQKEDFDNKAWVMSFLCVYPSEFNKVSARLKDDEDVVFIAVESRGFNMQLASARLQDDADFVAAAIENAEHPADILHHASQRLQSDPKFIIEIIHRVPEAISAIDINTFREHFEVALQLVNLNGHHLNKLCDEFRSNRQIVLTACYQNLQALSHIADHAKEDKDFLLFLASAYCAHSSSHSFLSYIESSLLSKEIVIAAMQNQAEYQYCPKQWKKDYDVLLAYSRAPIRIYRKIRIPNEKLRRLLVANVSVLESVHVIKDKGIIWSALEQYEAAEHKPGANIYELASKELKKDKEVALRCARAGFQVLHNSELQQDREIVEEAVKHYPMDILLVSDDLKEDIPIAIAAVSKNGLAYQHLSRTLRENRDVLMAYLYSGHASLDDIVIYNNELLFDKDFMLALVTKFPIFLSQSPLHEDREFCMLVAKKSGKILQYLSAEMKEDQEIVIECVKQDGIAVKFAPEKYKMDKEMVMMAVQSNRLALQFVSEEFLNDRDVVIAACEDTTQYACDVFPILSKEHKNNKEIVLKFVSLEKCFSIVPEHLRNDKEIALAAVTFAGEQLSFVSEQLQNDFDVVLAAVNSAEFAYGFASQALKENCEIMLHAYRKNHSIVRYFPRHKNTDIDLARELVALGYIGDFIAPITLARLKVNSFQKSARK